MPRFGEYESVREVYRGGLAVVYTARPPGSTEEKLALKVLELPEYLADEERVEQESVLFLESAETQRLCGAGSAAWAPVHASGRSDNGAWYATDFFERSAEKLVLHRRELEPAELYRVMEAVVQGLLALRQIARRPHGNLKPTNILVSGRGEAASARVVLCDPLATSRIRHDEDTVKDLKDLGDLLHQVVMHRPMRSAMAWPLSITTEWQRLGRVGGGWLELCNALLNPTGTPPSLDEVAGFLPELAAGPSSGSSALIAGATPQPGTMTPSSPAPSSPSPASAGRTPTPLPPVSRPDLSKSRPDSGFAPGPASASSAEITPPGSAPALGSGSGVTPIAPGSHPGSGAPARSGLGKWKEQEPVGLPEKGMPRASKVRLYAGVGVGAAVVVVGAAVYFTRGSKVEPVNPGPGPGETAGPAAPAFTEPDPRDTRYRQLVEETSEKAVKIRDLLNETAPDVDLANFNAAITSFDADRKSVAALAWNETTKDAVTAGVERLRSAARSVQDLTQSFGARSPDPRVTQRQNADVVMTAARSIADALSSDAAVVGQIEKVIESVQGQYNAADPKSPAWKPGQENGIARTYAKALEDSVTAGSARIKEIFAAVPDPRTGEGREGVEAAIAEARETAAALAALKKPIPDLDKDVTALSGALANLDPASVPWTLENVAAVRDSVTLVRQSADATLKKARDSWAKNATDPRPEARAAAERTVPELDGTGQQAAAALAAVPKVAALTEAQRTELIASIQSAVDALGAAKAALRESIDGSSAPEWGVRAAEEAQRQVERIGAADSAARSARDGLVSLMKKNEGVMAAAVEQRRKDLVEQGREIVAALNAGHEPTDEVGGAPLAERYRRLEGDSEFGAVKADAALAEAGQRLARLAAIGAGSDPVFLIRELRDASGKGLVAEGWLALSRLAAPEQKNVPAGAQDLAALAGAVAQLRDGAGRIGDAGRAKDMGARIAEAGRVLWRSFVSRLDFAVAADLKAARDTMGDFGLDVSALDDLGGRERFNFMLMDLRASLAGADDAGAKEAVAGFRARVQALDPATRDQDSVAAAFASLDQAINVSEPAAPPPPDYSALGPGKHGWAAVEGASGGVGIVTYRKGSGTIVFARATEETMVSTTEVSVGQFLEAVGAGGRWPDVVRLLPSRSVRTEGPRVWIWGVDGGQIELATPAPGGYSQGWLAEWPDKIRAVYPPALADRVAPPTLSMPMQHVSAAAAVYTAALLGCRLPTSEEWAAAMKVESGVSGGEPKFNRRDATWEEVRNFGIEQSQQPQNRSISPNWPDDGVFLPRGFPAGQVGSKAVPAVSENDGVLWFMPVDEGGGMLFHHLVGNVSEFVYEKPAEIEGIDPTFDTIMGKLGSNSDKAMLVMGASALSPPEIQPSGTNESRFSRANPGVAAKSDLGFRLAFTSKSGPPRPKPLPDRVRDAAGGLAFLPPK